VTLWLSFLLVAVEGRLSFERTVRPVVVAVILRFAQLLTTAKGVLIGELKSAANQRSCITRPRRAMSG
jgi:hypothetical protein